MLDFLNSNKDAFIALGVFIAALASMFAAYMISKAQRKNAIGQLKAEWVENLRIDIAAYINSTMKLAHEHDEKDDAEYNMLYNKIRLRLDDNNPTHKPIISTMDEIGNKLHSFGKEDEISKEDTDQINSLVSSMGRKAQSFLRDEWKSAARGKI